MRLLISALWLTFSCMIQLSQAQVNSTPNEFKNVGITEKLGQKAPLDLVFATSKGDSVKLGDLIGDRPVILNPVYYECPMLCTLVLNGLLKALQDLAWTPGEEFDVITYSIDPEEHHELAAQNKKAYIEQLGKKGAEKGWFFLTGKNAPLKQLSESIGFNYRWDEETQQWAHGAGIVFLMPDGTISRYLYGIDFNPFDVKNALTESGDGTIGTTADRILLYCYQYDPASRSYVPHAVNIMKIGGLFTLILLGSVLGGLWYKDHKNNSQA